MQTWHAMRPNRTDQRNDCSPVAIVSGGAKSAALRTYLDCRVEGFGIDAGCLEWGSNQGTCELQEGQEEQEEAEEEQGEEEEREGEEREEEGDKRREESEVR